MPRLPPVSLPQALTLRAPSDNICYANNTLPCLLLGEYKLQYYGDFAAFMLLGLPDAPFFFLLLFTSQVLVSRSLTAVGSLSLPAYIFEVCAHTNHLVLL